MAWLMSKADSKRQLLELAFQGAKFDFETQLSIAKTVPGSWIAPFAVYLHHSFEVARLIRDGNFSDETFRLLRQQRDRVMDIARDSKERSGSKHGRA